MEHYAGIKKDGVGDTLPHPRTSDTFCSVEAARHKGHILYKMSQRGNSTEAESRRVIVKGLGHGETEDS